MISLGGGGGKRLGWVWLLLCVVCPGGPSLLAAAPAKPVATPATVDEAVRKAVAWLYKEQKPDGYWEPVAARDPKNTTHDFRMDGPTHGGYTALCVFALLEAGEKPDDPRLAKSIAWLRTVPLGSIYSISLRCMIFNKLPPTAENLKQVQADAQVLMDSMIRGGRAEGGWDYTLSPPAVAPRREGNVDHSVSQFAALGLWAAAQSGVRVPPDLWRQTELMLRTHQLKDGGWAYNKAANEPAASTGAMTAAGVATLLIMQDTLGVASSAPPPTGSSSPASRPGGALRGAGVTSENQFGGSGALVPQAAVAPGKGGKKKRRENSSDNPSPPAPAPAPKPTSSATPVAHTTTSADIAIVRGLRWLDKNFERVIGEGSYALYAVERIGTAGGYRSIGSHDWYAEGAASILERQEPGGNFRPGTVVTATTPLSEVALSILFLVHGRAPVLVNKLNYAGGVGSSPSMVWNRRPRDVANLVRFTGNAAEQAYNWQVVSLQAPLPDLMSVPVLILSGSAALDLDVGEVARLKAYVESGGLLIATPEKPAPDRLGSDPFSASFIKLGKEMFNFGFRPLPANHPIFTDQQFRPSRWPGLPVVWGLSNGVREYMIVLPEGDPGKVWNGGSYKTTPLPFEVGADLLQYAVSRQPELSKGQSHIVRPRFLMDVETKSVEEGAATQPATQPATAPTLGGPVAVEVPGVEALVPANEVQHLLRIPEGATRLVVGRLDVGQNWNPEPGAWRRLATIMANDHQIFVELREVALTPSDLKDVQLLHWTGTTSVTLSEAEGEVLRKYVEGGGVLVVDAAGGSTPFADSAQAALAKTFGQSGGTIGTVLAADDSFFHKRGAEIKRFEYRRYYASRAGGKLDAPRLQGIDRDGQTVVFFSREDLTAGCVGQNTDGISGYSPRTATAIMRNVVLQAAKRR